MPIYTCFDQHISEPPMDDDDTERIIPVSAPSEDLRAWEIARLKSDILRITIRMARLEMQRAADQRRLSDMEGEL